MGACNAAVQLTSGRARSRRMRCNGSLPRSALHAGTRSERAMTRSDMTASASLAAVGRGIKTFATQITRM